ncbi:MAG TPA: hypothetical protein VGF53_06090 [Pseudolabrys sp.]|jgi:hypothetical protein
MRKLSSVTVAVIVGIALYFTLAWGYEGLRTISSPSYGLDDVWRSQFVFAIGSLFGLGPIGLIKLAAFFGTVKLAVASICAVHVLDRLRVFIGGKPDSEIFEGGLILVVLISIVSVGPAVMSHNAELVREATIQLILAAIATALCLVERSQNRPAGNAEPAAVAELAATARAAPWFSPFR